MIPAERSIQILCLAAFVVVFCGGFVPMLCGGIEWIFNIGGIRKGRR